MMMSKGTSLRVLVVAGLLSVTAFSSALAQQSRGQRQNRFAGMDQNGDGVITRKEWKGNNRSFRAQDWNGDGVLSGDEVRPDGRRRTDDATPDWSDDARRDNDDVNQARVMDRNRDGWISRDEWQGAPELFERLDGNRDGVLSGTELDGLDGTSLSFETLDINRDGQVTPNEWRGMRASFEQRDRNHDGRLSRDEFRIPTTRSQGRAWQAGFERGRIEGLQAGREDRERSQGWDLEGQRELEQADSGYTPGVGARAEYQAGYREAFRVAYREGYGR